MQDLVDVKNRFLASVSHEIRTPLTAILGFARVLDEDPALGVEDRGAMVSSIVELSQEMADMIEDLLVVARADMGQIEVTRAVFDVFEQIEQTLATGGSFTADVIVGSESGQSPAIGDSARFRQIVRNLLTNAERYGGDLVRVEVTRRGDRVLVEVTDDGPGLPAAEWERIFEPYHRVHDQPGQPGSVGIGLSISRQLAEMMGGTLRYEYRSGLSRFILSLEASATGPEPMDGD
jgi:signal transduction histidine kinase